MPQRRRRGDAEGVEVRHVDPPVVERRRMALRESADDRDPRRVRPNDAAIRSI
jgi:hypothetical protein